MDESREKRDTSQVFTNRSASPTVRNGTWISAMSWSNIVIKLSIIILLVATLITDLIRHTVVHLKSGLACIRVFGESPDFLEKSCLAKTQKSGFFGQVLF